MARTNKRRQPMPKTGSEDVPPGATRQAFDRDRDRDEEHGPGAGAGPRHAANDPGSPEEDYGPTDTNDPLAEGAADEGPGESNNAPPYSGPAGGAVGGSPAERRSSGGRTGRGLRPGGDRPGDSTIGSR
jgi:hypothetical protein